MNCEILRQRLTEDPSRIDLEVEAHAETCAACRAFRSRLLRAEEAIESALRFDVKALKHGSSNAPSATATRSRRVVLTSGVAAALAVGVTFWVMRGGDADLAPEALAAEVTQHWYDEPESWFDSDEQVSDDLLASVLDGAAQLNRGALQTVSFAKICWVAGEMIPHLVIQGEQSPVMVLLMPGRQLERPVPLALPNEGLSGHILPAGNGSIAILGGEPGMEQVETTIVSAVDWTT